MDRQAGLRRFHDRPLLCRDARFTVGALGDQVFAVVETITDRELYDYEAKYTPGESRKQAPADLSDAGLFEGQHDFSVGLSQEAPFAVVRLDDPHGHRG